MQANCLAEGNGKAEAPIGQKVTFTLPTPLPEFGKFQLSFVLMPSCWLGCDVTTPLSINVQKQTVLEKQGKGKSRGAAGKRAIPLDDDEHSDKVRLGLRIAEHRVPMYMQQCARMLHMAQNALPCAVHWTMTGNAAQRNVALAAGSVMSLDTLA